MGDGTKYLVFEQVDVLSAEAEEGRHPGVERTVFVAFRKIGSLTAGNADHALRVWVKERGEGGGNLVAVAEAKFRPRPTKTTTQLGAPVDVA